jgi:hypothetical protein
MKPVCSATGMKSAGLTVLGMAPADERFEAGERAARERDDGLVFQDELLLLQTIVQLGEQRDELLVLEPDLGVEGRTAAPSVLLARAVEGGGRVAHDLLGALVGAVARDDADDGGGRHPMAADHDPLADHVLDAIREPGCLLGVARRAQQDGELPAP